MEPSPERPDLPSGIAPATLVLSVLRRLSTAAPLGLSGSRLRHGYLVALDFSRSALNSTRSNTSGSGSAGRPYAGSAPRWSWRVAGRPPGTPDPGLRDLPRVNKALATSDAPCSFGAPFRVRPPRLDAARLRLRPPRGLLRGHGRHVLLLLFRAQHPEARGDHPGLRPLRRDLHHRGADGLGPSPPRAPGPGPGQDPRGLAAALFAAVLGTKRSS
jgi:hypothetical protein